MAATVGDSANILHGTTKVEVLVYDPANIGVPLQAFTDIGYSEENVTLTTDTTVEDVLVAEEVDPVDQLITARQATIAIAFKEFTIDNVFLAMSEATHTLGTGSLSMGRKNATPTLTRLGMRLSGVNEAGFDRVIFAGHAIPVGNAEQAFSIRAKTLVAGEFRAVRPSINQSVVKNFEFTADLTSWVVGAAGWAQNAADGGVARTSAADTLTQTLLNFVNGVPYVVRFDVSTFTSGDVTPTLGSVAGTAVTANAAKIEQIITPTEAGGADLVFTSSTTPVLDIDKVYVFPADVLSYFDKTA